MEQGRKALREMNKALLILTLALMGGASCANQKNSQTSNAGASQSTPTPASATPPVAESSRDVSKEIKETKEVPTEFKGIDFKNLAYPISWKHRTIPLKDGHVEYFENKYLGNAWFDFSDVDYMDLRGDGAKDAVVQLLQVSCGASCDGGSHLFYFYSIKRGRLRLLSRIETGSLAADGCGLKSFVLEKTTLVLEVFRVCRFDGVSLMPTYDPHPNPNAQTGKYMADKFTRFVLAFSGNRFRLKKREVFPNPQEDISNYPSKVSISDD
jgi:hypothetical protein